VEEVIVPRPAVFDTSVFVGRESRGVGALAAWAPIVSVITVAELSLGVAASSTASIRARRSRTLGDATRAVVVGIVAGEELDVVGAWVTLRRSLGRRMPANDTWIAATAIALGVPVITQDDDYDAASSILEVVKV
jgi:predicted nucleic acid-binding protein